MYQALSPPPLKGPGDEARVCSDSKNANESSQSGTYFVGFGLIVLHFLIVWHSLELVALS